MNVEMTQLLATRGQEKTPKMAGAIKSRLRQHGRAVVLALGPRMVATSVKAAIQAGRFLREDQGAAGPEAKLPAIGLIPSEHEFAPRSRKAEKKRGEDDAPVIGMRLECIDVRERQEQLVASGSEDLPPWEQEA